MEPEGSLPHLQKPSTCSCPELVPKDQSGSEASAYDS
jgi:hypothetical protein